MTFEERMQQLGRRALEQEPYELALPRFIRAAECVKPISCVHYRVERHGCFEGRLPIPDTVIRDNIDEGQDASRSTVRKRHGSATRSSQVHKAQGGALLRSSQLEALKQLDAIKAHKKAAKEYSESVERRNNQMLQRNKMSYSRHAAARRSKASACDHHVGAPQGGPGIHQPFVERHVPPHTSTGGVADGTLPLDPPGPKQCDSDSTHAAAPADCCGSGCCLNEDSATTAGGPGGHAQRAVTADTPACICSDEAVQYPQMVPGRVTAPALPSNTPTAGGTVTNVAAVAADIDTPATACLDSSSASSRLLHHASQVHPVQQTAVATLALSPSTSTAAASEVRHPPDGYSHADHGQADDQAFSSALRRSDSTCGSTASGAAVEVAAGGSRGVDGAGAEGQPHTDHPVSCVSGSWFVEQEPMQQAPVVAPLRSSQQNQQQAHAQQQQQQQQGAALPAAQPSSLQPPAMVNVRLPWQDVKGRASVSSQQVIARASSCRASVSRVGEKGVAAVLKGAAAVERLSNAAPAGFSSPELVRLAAAAADKVAKRQLVLPALCSCGHGTSVLDAAYTKQCCNNCPLRCDRAAYEQLLTGLLSAMGV